MALALLGALLPEEGSGQEGSWSVEGQIGGSVFFGNQSQTTFTTRGLVERTDQLFESNSSLRFSYGQATDDEGITSVNRRSWVAQSTLDLIPDERWRPFLSGRMESSLERQIALRYDAGAGAKVDLMRRDDGRMDLSVSVVAERTLPRDPDPGDDTDITVARLSTRLDIRRSMQDGRISFRSDNRYQPVFDDLNNFTFSSTNTLSFELTEVVRLQVTLEDEYDSGARDRGAQTNHQGQLELSIAARL